jgi:hypothetical protein
MVRPLLVVFSGLPGTGKTTLARRLSRERNACYLRVDAVETALARVGTPVGASGYAVVHELAVSNLLLGHDVVVDAVNPVPVARAGWREQSRGGTRIWLLSRPSWQIRSSTGDGSRNETLTSQVTCLRRGKRSRTGIGFRGKRSATAADSSSTHQTLTRHGFGCSQGFRPMVVASRSE